MLSRTFLMLSMMLLLLSSVLAEEVDQESRAMAYVAALGQSDFDVYEQALQVHRQPEVLAASTEADRQRSFEELKEYLGEIEVLGAMLTGPTETRVLIQPSTSEEPLEIVFGHDLTQASKITSINFTPLAPSLELPATIGSLKELLAHIIEQTNVPAFGVAVFSSSSLIEQAVVGQREIGLNKPVSEDSSFHWGSVTKSVTATVAARLVAQEMLTWEASIADVFGKENVLPDYHAVTIADLLNHRSGLPAFDDFEASYVQQFTSQAPSHPSKQRELMAADVLTEKPIYPPKNGHRYSNAGYIVAGVMLEKVSNKSWEQLVIDEVFIPLKMANSGLGWPDQKVNHNPSGHFGMSADSLEVAPQDAMNDLMGLAAPAGNVHSSLDDMVKYAMAHLAGMQGKGSLLSADEFQYLHTPPSGELERAEPYSFGWGHVVLESGAPMQWHNGGAGSFYAEIRLLPELDLGFAIMANAGYAERVLPPLWDALQARYLPANGN